MVERTAESVVLTPDLQLQSERHQSGSLSAITISILSSISGVAQIEQEVCLRALESKGEIRTKRWTRIRISRDHRQRASTINETDLMPALSPSAYLSAKFKPLILGFI